MHALLGEPVARGVAEGVEYEEFRTRMVIAKSQWLAEGYGMLWVTTCGAVDLIGVPYELCLLSKRTLLGQTIRVTYRQDGGIANVERDGESVLEFDGAFRAPDENHPAPDGQQGDEPIPSSGQPPL
jgi:hypothetical protein